MSSYRTAWSRNPSSLISDRIPSSNAQRSVPKTIGAKGKNKDAEVPRSREVRRLEELRDGLRDSMGNPPVRDPTYGGCFCQARDHELSSYIPICRKCGLILCELNLPHYACPHCTSSLLTPDATNALLSSLEQSIVDTLAAEEHARQQAAEEARRAIGAFPTLGGPSLDVSLRSLNNSNTSLNSLESHPVNHPHKALSLNSKTKKVTVASYKTVVPMAKTPVTKEQQETPEPELRRVPRPPKEVPYRSKLDADRPWMNVRADPVTYVPPPKSNAEGSSKGRSKRKGKQASSTGRDSKENSDVKT